MASRRPSKSSKPPTADGVLSSHPPSLSLPAVIAIHRSWPFTSSISIKVSLGNGCIGDCWVQLASSAASIIHDLHNSVACIWSWQCVALEAQVQVVQLITAVMNHFHALQLLTALCHYWPSVINRHSVRMKVYFVLRCSLLLAALHQRFVLRVEVGFFSVFLHGVTQYQATKLLPKKTSFFGRKKWQACHSTLSEDRA